jgi:hypothetical protein
LLSVWVLISLFLSNGRGSFRSCPRGRTKLCSALQSRSPDHPLALASRRYSGADKKEKQKGRKQQQASHQQQPGLLGLLFRMGDGNGAGALHLLGS